MGESYRKTYLFNGGLKDSTNRLLEGFEDSLTNVNSMQIHQDTLVNNLGMQIYPQGKASLTNDFSAFVTCMPAGWLSAVSGMRYLFSYKDYGVERITEYVYLPLSWNIGLPSGILIRAYLKPWNYNTSSWTGATTIMANDVIRLMGSGVSTLAFSFGTNDIVFHQNDMLAFEAMTQASLPAYPWDGPITVNRFYLPETRDDFMDVHVDYWSDIYVAGDLNDRDTHHRGLVNNISNSYNSWLCQYFQNVCPKISAVEILEPSAGMINRTVICNHKNIYYFTFQDNLRWPIITSNVFSVGTGNKQYNNHMTPINMNDRRGLLFGGESTVPGFIYASGSCYYGFTSTMNTYFLNGVASNASGLESVIVYPKMFVEFKNKMHYINSHMIYENLSLPSTTVSEYYPCSIFPSSAYIPNIIDWDEEIIVDDIDEITAYCVYKDCLFVFSKSKINYFGYDSTGVVTSIQELTNLFGTRYKSAVCVANNLIYFANENGLYSTDGLSITKVSVTIDTIWKNEYAPLLNTNVIDTTDLTVLWDKVHEWIIVSFSGTTKSTGRCDRGMRSLIYNLDKGTWGSYPIALAGVVNNNNDVFWVTRHGGILSPNFNATLVSGINEFMEIYSASGIGVYGASGIALFSKKIMLAPDFNKQAISTQIRMIWDSPKYSSLNGNHQSSYILNAYWDGQPSQNYSLQTFLVSATLTGYCIDGSHTMLVNGQGNELTVELTRNYPNNGADVLRLLGMEIDFTLDDRSW